MPHNEQSLAGRARQNNSIIDEFGTFAGTVNGTDGGVTNIPFGDGTEPGANPGTEAPFDDVLSFNDPRRPIGPDDRDEPRRPGESRPLSPKFGPGGVPAADFSVDSQLKRILGENSPLLQRANTQGLQRANRRGLLNSSIAVGAAENAVIDAALPIAAQNAAQNFQGGLQRTEIASRELIASLDRDMQVKIANMNVAAHDREKAVAAVATFAAVYSDMYKAIQNNPNMPADERAAALDFISQIRDENFALLEQLYNFDLVWGPDLFEDEDTSGNTGLAGDIADTVRGIL